jgi:heme/copper-type cytochrome/quinol oxidase subunit 4
LGGLSCHHNFQKNNFMTSFKYYIAGKLKKAFWLGLFVLAIWIINYGLWSVGETFVLFFIILLIFLKLVTILLYFFQARNKLEKHISLFVVLALVLFTALLFDFVVVPDLWIDKFGISTEGTATDFQMRQNMRGKRYFITYEFNANEATHTDSQSVNVSLYEKLKLSPSAQIKYLSGYPNISYLHDEEYLKMSTWLNLLLGIGIIFLLYLDKIENGFDKIGKVA